MLTTLQISWFLLLALRKDSVEPIPTELVKALISQELLEGEPLETLFRYCPRWFEAPVRSTKPNIV